MRLFRYEFRKVWFSRIIIIVVLAVVLLNTILIWSADKEGISSIHSSSYKLLGDEFRALNMGNRIQMINDRFAEAEGVYKIMEVYAAAAIGETEYANRLRSQLIESFNKYEELYLLNDYLHYTSNIETEYLFLYEIKEELNSVTRYDEYLQNIQERAAELSNISIFASDDYDQATLSATAKVYDNMADVDIDYYPQKGLNIALSFSHSDILLLLIILTISVALVREEKESGLLNFVRSSPAGRLKTAAAKIFVLGVSSMLIVILLYGMALLYCSRTFGLGDLMRSIQSVPSLIQSTMKISVLQYLLAYCLAKSVAVFALGLWTMLSMLLMRHIAGAYGMAVFLPAVMLGTRQIISSSSKLGVLKYANLISILNTHELLGVYRTLYWFCKPISMALVEVATTVIFIVIFTMAFLVTFSRAELHLANKRTFSLSGWISKRLNRATTILHQEAYKLLIMNGAGIILLLFIGFQVYTTSVTKSYINADEIYYRRYMTELSGPYTSESASWINDEYRKFEPIIHLNKMAEAGVISAIEYSNAIAPYYSLTQEFAVFERVLERLNYVIDTYGAELVYDTGYKTCFGFYAENDTVNAVIVVSVIVLCLSAFFSVENSTGMDKILLVTPLGRTKTAAIKIKLTILLASIVGFFTSLPHLWQMVTKYGLPNPMASIVSLPEYSDGYSVFNLLSLTCLAVFARVAACVLVAIMTVYLSSRLKRSLTVIVSSLLLFATPLLLSMIGVKDVKWLSIWSLFHLPVLFARKDLTIFVVLLLAISIALVVAGTHYTVVNSNKSRDK